MSYVCANDVVCLVKCYTIESFGENLRLLAKYKLIY